MQRKLRVKRKKLELEKYSVSDAVVHADISYSQENSISNLSDSSSQMQMSRKRRKGTPIDAWTITQDTNSYRALRILCLVNSVYIVTIYPYYTLNGFPAIFS